MKRALSLALSLGAAACAGGPDDNDPTVDADPNNPAPDEWDDRLAERVVDYNAAFRAASLRLVGELPTLEQIHRIADAADDVAREAAYEALIVELMDDPRFARQVYYWWQDTLKLGDDPALDSAAAFAAQVTVEGRAYTELFTATAGQCGSFDPATSAFTPGDCANGVATHAGLLTHPGMNRHYYGNFAFRRVKWVQETFACTKFPAEVASAVDVGGAAPYTGVFPFESVPDATTGRVNFRDVSAVTCANCHSTMNHVAPLFAHFDDQGMYQAEIAVRTPLEGAPLAELADYLVAGEVTAWRYGVPAADLPGLGAAMAADPAITECAIARVWNWALGKSDIVDSVREVPSEVIRQQIDDFVADGHRLRDALYNVFTSDDFVKF